ncbi:MAG: hypothetical protein EA396_05240 [Anaerolineaceae bacterium]|nr:MAG: hypothetical protein EA396_05240 [Anaerolineaceae bacterium]
MRLLLVLLIMPFAVLLAACGGDGNDESAGADDEAARVVERYLEAKVAGDFDGVRDNLCAAMEADLEREAFSFSGVEAQINDMACRADDDALTVTCDGQIEALYGADTRFFELTTYNVTREDGVWRWCGEAADGEQ